MEVCGTLTVTTLKNVRELNIQMQLFSTLLFMVDNEGKTIASKKKLGEYLGGKEKPVSEATIGAHLIKFAQCQMLKYKYSGRLFINPRFFYKGSPADRERVYKEYLDFKSDV